MEAKLNTRKGIQSCLLAFWPKRDARLINTEQLGPSTTLGTQKPPLRGTMKTGAAPKAAPSNDIDLLRFRIKCGHRGFDEFRILTGTGAFNILPRVHDMDEEIEDEVK